MAIKEPNLYDEFIAFKRFTEDALENLDMDNFSSTFQKHITDAVKSSAGFNASATDEEAIAEMFAKFETQYSKALADVTAKANANEASITSITEWQDETKENITRIESKSNANGSFISLIASSGLENSRIETDNEGNSYYVTKNSEGDEDRVPVDNSNIASIFLKSVNGNTSEVIINADQIKLGKGLDVWENSVIVNNLFGKSTGTVQIGGVKYPGAYYAEISSSVITGAGEKAKGGDFFIKKIPNWYDGIIDEDCEELYGFQFDQTLGENEFSVNFEVGAAGGFPKHSIIGYNYGKGKTYPKGDWDFSSSNVVGIPVYFS